MKEQWRTLNTCHDWEWKYKTHRIKINSNMAFTTFVEFHFKREEKKKQNFLKAFCKRPHSTSMFQGMNEWTDGWEVSNLIFLGGFCPQASEFLTSQFSVMQTGLRIYAERHPCVNYPRFIPVFPILCHWPKHVLARVQSALQKQVPSHSQRNCWIRTLRWWLSGCKRRQSWEQDWAAQFTASWLCYSFLQQKPS